MRRNATTWTGQEDDELWRLFNQGVSRLRLSVRLRRTQRAVESRLTLLRRKHRAAAPASHYEQRPSR